MVLLMVVIMEVEQGYVESDDGRGGGYGRHARGDNNDDGGDSVEG